MTWELRSAAAIGMAHIALAVVVAGILGGASQVVAIELGEVHAVQSNSPPYIFRLPLLTPLHGSAASRRSDGAATTRYPCIRQAARRGIPSALSERCRAGGQLWGANT